MTKKKQTKKVTGDEQVAAWKKRKAKNRKTLEAQKHKRQKRAAELAKTHSVHTQKVKLELDKPGDAIYWNESYEFTFQDFQDIFGFTPDESGSYFVNFRAVAE